MSITMLNSILVEQQRLGYNMKSICSKDFGCIHSIRMFLVTEVFHYNKCVLLRSILHHCMIRSFGKLSFWLRVLYSSLNIQLNILVLYIHSKHVFQWCRVYLGNRRVLLGNNGHHCMMRLRA